MIEFNRGNVRDSLKSLKEIISENPRAPSDIWFAIGLCYYRLGDLLKSKLSLEKTLEVDPQNSMALAASGIIELASNVNDYDARDAAIGFFERSFNANPRNPIALKYLAEHYFYKKQYELSKELCMAGIMVLKNKNKPERVDIVTFRQDIQLLRSDFYFINGKISHALEKYTEAFQHYEESLRHNTKNMKTLFCLAKVHF